MYKSLILVFVVLIGAVAADKRPLKLQSSHIQRIVKPLHQGNVGLDWCPQCIDTWDDIVQVVLDVILQYGVLDTCGHLCDIVESKTGSGVLGFICNFGCDFLGLDEFIKLMNKADIDPIYYCEKMSLCPINDNGDAKFKSFAVLPARAKMGTKIAIDFVYVSKNGTGTGEMILSIQTVDKVPLSAGLLVEAQKPGTYGDRIAIDTSPDPECDPTQSQCEEWLQGVYNVTVILCNGQCGSHHPHSAIYDTAHGSFSLYEE
ncbi:unnamed protein product [Adineta steineri]|uniref:Countin-like protein n=2 Tax=Adineta steineri TaxID=433720 RepID=A0A813MC23_9BILA|nr:unnamed protein product [Adineta steineri]